MITLDMSKKLNSVVIKDITFDTETNLLQLMIKVVNGAEPYNLINKDITAIFKQTSIETGILSVTDDMIIVLPITKALITHGLNQIQLTFRQGDVIEKSPIMLWRVGEGLISSLTATQEQVDIITSLIAQSRDAMQDQNQNGLGKIRLWTGSVEAYEALETSGTIDANGIYFIGWGGN